MRTIGIIIALAVCAMAPAFALLNIPGDGSDGVLTITTNTVIDLSQAVTGVWSNNNSANAGKGIYDSNKWAVVFKYRAVTIGASNIVTFKNHASRAPVVWLVQSNVSVAANARIDLTGQRSGVSVVTNLEAGPGGFRSAVQGGSALGPGGAINTNATYRSSYGNPTLIPLIGGSGLNEGSQNSYAAGGGAILIAAANTITNNGTIQSRGANGLFFNASGGGIRLVSESLQGSGTVDAQPEGRLRIEANTVSGGITLLPSTAIAPPGATPTIWPPATAPVCTILSVGGVSVSSDPRADFGLMPDATIYASNPVEVLLQTQNFPTSGVVQVRVAPKTTTNTVWTTANCISGTVISATWRASITLTNVMTMLQARASSQ